MNIQNILTMHDYILMEGTITEILRRSGNAFLHPYLEDSLLIYDKVGRAALADLYE